MSVIHCVRMNKAIRARPRKGTSVHFNTRLPGTLTAMLRSFARRHRLTPSGAAARILEEGLRMEFFPGIDFRPTPLGREAFVTGTGLTAWEMNHLWNDHGRSMPRLLRGFPHLRSSQVTVGVAYMRHYPEEEPEEGWGIRPHGTTEFQV